MYISIYLFVYLFLLELSVSQSFSSNFGMRQSQGPSSEPIPFKGKAASSARYSLSKMKASELDVRSVF